MIFLRSKVVCPSSPADAKGLLTASIEDNNPVIFYEHKGLYRKIKEEVPEGYYSIPLGKANIVIICAIEFALSLSC